ncbi:hypothetical protein TVAG_179720 [Trichomonas vaginalis G3]|uniref:Sel1 repeat family protein n=1 Tax=Trichomonas vaginalis (strain ATCC PRA-98 / G3) TaxID=412133 RepID=A2F454_TRIV3|nr:SEL-1-like protein family [Trichomonas vaginalis G3]EAY00301.1 hypothetical protein TVAG_179720 [Trichomonas vaginalis G3]KAI5490874.1 SEL-1-like protein family [Trichomonas vaginalis G3]|eukprot:XP_001313230.1 hypothetical protein [Trichomonas vaginalis G3]
MLFPFFSLHIASKPLKRQFPFYPTLKEECDTGDPCIVDYFSLETVDKRSFSYPIIKKCVKGYLENKNHSNCITRLQSHAENNGDAAFILGNIYEFGLMGVKPNDKTARHFYSLGTHLGHAECQYSLSFMQRYGLGGSKDVLQSYMLLKAASLAGSIPAIITESFLDFYGFNRPKSCYAAYEKLNPIMQIMMKNLTHDRLRDSLGVTRIYPSMIRLFTRLSNNFKKTLKEANADNPKALIEAGKYYLWTEKNYSYAEEIFKKAADLGVSEANHYLGLIYRYGYGHDVDNYMAEIYFKKSIQGGISSSQVELSKMMIKEGTNFETGFAYLKVLSHIDCDAAYNYHLLALGMTEIEPKNTSKFLFDIYNVTNRCANLPHIPSIYLSAAYTVEGVNFKPDCKRGFYKMFLAAELSPFFDMARTAFNFYMKSDTNYSLRLYQKIADWGSEAAMGNVKIILDDRKEDATDWVEMLQKLKFPDAILVKAKNNLKNGNAVKGEKELNKAAENSNAAKYEAAKYYFRSDPARSLHYLRDLYQSNPSSFFAVLYLSVLILLRNVPIGLFTFINGANTKEAEVVWVIIQNYAVDVLLCISFVTFSFFLRKRIQLIIEQK